MTLQVFKVCIPSLATSPEHRHLFDRTRDILWAGAGHATSPKRVV